MTAPRYDVLGIGNAIVDVIARAENGVVAKIKRCGQSFCQLEFENNIEGWMQRSILYGIKKGEIIE